MPTQTFNSSGSWEVPAGVTEVTVECWGGGGSGGANNVSNAGGGGGGGAYSKKIVSVVPGAAETIVVGAGGTNGQWGGNTWFRDEETVLARAGDGGGLAQDGVLGEGGQASAGVGDVKWSGGNGGTNFFSSQTAGGGGGSARTTSNGGNGAAGISGGAGGVGTGAGGFGGTRFFGGQNGFAPGGGGGGAGGDTFSGPGLGASGRVVLTWDDDSSSSSSLSSSASSASSSNYTAPEIRGSWCVTEGFMARLNGSGAQDWLKSKGEWVGKSADFKAKKVAIEQGELRPKTPMPYVVFTQDDPVVVENDGGKRRDEHSRRELVRVTFTAVARSSELAADAIKMIKTALEGKPIDPAPDRWVQTLSGGDFPSRLGDTEYAWTWIVEYMVDAHFSTNR